MKKGYQIIIGTFFISLFIAFFVMIGWYMWFQQYTKSITIVAEGIVDGMYINPKSFLSRATYFLLVNGKAVEVSKIAYNMVQVGDLVRVFADMHVMIL